MPRIYKVEATSPASKKARFDSIGSEVEISTSHVNESVHKNSGGVKVEDENLKSANDVSTASTHGENTPITNSSSVNLPYRIIVKSQAHPFFVPEKFTENADFHIQSCDGREFGVNMVILASKSEVFKTLFNTNMSGKGVAVDFPSHIIREVLKFVHEGKVTEEFAELVDQVYFAADTFSMAELKDYCEEKLIRLINTDNICESIDMAKSYGGDLLLAASLKFIRDEREDSEMPWDRLGKLIDAEGKLLKEIVQVAAEKTSVKRV